MPGSSNGIVTSVAVATAALNVRASVVGFVIAALTAVAPAMSVVYFGTPLRMTGWSNVIVRTEAAAVAFVIRTGVFCLGIARSGVRWVGAFNMMNSFEVE